MPRSEPIDLDLEQLMVRLELTIPGEVSAIPSAVDSIMGVIRQMKCAEGDEHQIELALNEALANAVVHGCGEDPDRQVEIAVGCDEDKGVVVVVRDPGEGFDPGEVPSPLQGENLYASHGRGVFLINRLMDQVHYRRGGTELWMKKKGS